LTLRRFLCYAHASQKTIKRAILFYSFARIVLKGGPIKMELLDERAAAEKTGLSVRTHQKMRVQGRGPIFTKLGKRVFYLKEDLEEWIFSGRRRSTSDPGPDKESNSE